MLLTLLACAPSDPGLTLDDTVPYVDGELLVRFRGDAADAMHVEDENALEEAEHIGGIDVKRVRIPEGKSVRSVVEKLAEDHRVEFAEPNLLVRRTADPYREYQWNLDELGVPDAHAYGTGGGLVVAVLDTGVRKSGPDGIANLLAGYDFYYGDADPTDKDGHGTFVAGTIAQKTGNGVGVEGVAPGVAILPVKVMSDEGYGDISAIANGLVWATDSGVSVVNMSLGSAYPSSTLERAVTYAHDNGTVVVAATGNEYASKISYPAAYPSVIAVGATGRDGVRAGYSNVGTGIDLVAPGGDLSKDVDGDGYADGILQETIENGRWTYTFWEGTSMAAPHVAAAAALVMAQGVEDPDDVAAILTGTAVDRGSRGYDTAYGYGSLDIGAAVAKAAGEEVGSGTPSTGETETPSGGADTTAPKISAVSGYTQGTRFTISWTTDEPADSYVNFEGVGAYGDDALVTSHSLTFTGSRGVTYEFTIESTDAAGNKGSDGVWTISL